MTIYLISRVAAGLLRSAPDNEKQAESSQTQK